MEEDKNKKTFNTEEAKSKTLTKVASESVKSTDEEVKSEENKSEEAKSETKKSEVVKVDPIMKPKKGEAVRMLPTGEVDKYGNNTFKPFPESKVKAHLEKLNKLNK